MQITTIATPDLSQLRQVYACAFQGYMMLHTQLGSIGEPVADLWACGNLYMTMIDADTWLAVELIHSDLQSLLLFERLIYESLGSDEPMLSVLQRSAKLAAL